MNRCIYLLHFLLVITLWVQSAPLRAATTDPGTEDLWTLARKMLAERIEKNEALRLAGREAEVDYIIDMYTLLEKEKQFINTYPHEVLANAYDQTDIEPYVIIMLPQPQYALNNLFDDTTIDTTRTTSPTANSRKKTVIANKNNNTRRITVLMLQARFLSKGETIKALYYTGADGSVAAEEQLGFTMVDGWTTVENNLLAQANPTEQTNNDTPKYTDDDATSQTDGDDTQTTTENDRSQYLTPRIHLYANLLINGIPGSDRPCAELLNTYADHPFVKDPDNFFYHLVQKDPCLMRNLINYKEDIPPALTLENAYYYIKAEEQITRTEEIRAGETGASYTLNKLRDELETMIQKSIYTKNLTGGTEAQQNYLEDKFQTFYQVKTKQIFLIKMEVGYYLPDEEAATLAEQVASDTPGFDESNMLLVVSIIYQTFKFAKADLQMSAHTVAFNSVTGFQRIVPDNTASFFKLASAVYKQIPKPYCIYKHIFTITEDYIYSEVKLKNASGGYDVTGYDRIYDLEILCDKQALWDLHNEETVYVLALDNIPNSLYDLFKDQHLEKKAAIENRPPTYDREKIYLKEQYIPTLGKHYVDYIYTPTNEPISKIFGEKISLILMVDGYSNKIDPKIHLLNAEEIIDEVVYFALDVLSFIPGVDTPCEIVGTIYSIAREKYQEAAIYGAGLLVAGATISNLAHLSGAIKLKETAVIYNGKTILTNTDDFAVAVADITKVSDNAISTKIAAHPQAKELFYYNNREYLDKLKLHPQRDNVLSKISETDNLMNSVRMALLTSEQEVFLTGLKKYVNDKDAEKLFIYYENYMTGVTVKQRGTEAMVDGREELLKMISTYANRDDLIADPSLLNCWAFLGNFPNIRGYPECLQNVKTIYANELYKSVTDVGTFEALQKNINSSNNVQELLEKLAQAKNADEFELALKEIKVIDYPVAELLEFTLKSTAKVHPNYVNNYNTIVSDLKKAVNNRANTALTQQEKAVLSEQIGELTARKVMLEEGYIPLEHRISTSAKQGQFDCIFWNGNTNNPHVILVEAKGGSGPTGSRNIEFVEQYRGKRAAQGTTIYRNDIIANMQDAIDNNNVPANLINEIESTLNNINLAQREKNLDYLLIRQEIDTDGTLGKISVNKFPTTELD